MKPKKKFIAGGTFLILIIVTGIFYLLGDNHGKTKEATWICEEGIENIQSISILNNEDSQSLSFVKEKDHWQGSDGSVYDNNQFASYTAVLGYMRVEKEIAVKEDEKQDYGLDHPAYTVSVTYSNGKKFGYNLGKYVDELGLYISMDHKKSVSLIDLQRAKTMETMVASLYDVKLTDVKFDEIRGINLFSRENGLISINRSEAPRADGGFYWNIFRPYAWIANTHKIQEIIETVENIVTLKRTGNAITPEMCGLGGNEGEPDTVTFYDAHDSELILYLGDTYGEWVYCKTNSLDDVYLIDKKILELVHMRVDDMIDPVLYYYEVPSVERCLISWKGENHELIAQWVSDTEKAKRGQRYYLDGNSITGADYHSIVEWFSNTKIIQATGLPDNQGEVLGTVTIDRLSAPYQQTLTIREIQGDNSLVLVTIGSSAAAYLKRDEVENFIVSLQ